MGASQKFIIISFLLQSILGLVSGLSAVVGRNSNLEATFVTSRGWCDSQDVYNLLNFCGSIPGPFWGRRSCCGGAMETIKSCGDPQPCKSQYAEAIKKNCNENCLPEVQEDGDNEEIGTNGALCGDATVMTVLGICKMFPFWGQTACCGNALETIKACGYPRPCNSKFTADINAKCEGICKLRL